MFPVTLVDALSHRVTLAHAPKRIISLGPSVTEILFDLGVGSRVVADTTYDNYPPPAAKLPRVGDFVNPSTEKILAFRPDLVVATRGNSTAALATLSRLQVPVFAVDPKTYSDVASNVIQLGQLTGTAPRAAAIARYMSEMRLRIMQAVRKSHLARPRCLIEVWNSPLTVVGPNSFVGDVLSIAGGKNVAPVAPGGYPRISSESALLLRPDVIFLTEPGLEPDSVRQRPGWRLAPAVKSNRIYKIDPDILNRPAPRIAIALQQIARDLYPNVFKR